MAAYREHVAFSTLLGILSGGGAYALGFNPVQAVLAGCLTGIGGILPDLDSESGKPVREVFGLTAAMAPLLMIHRLEAWGGGNLDNVVLLSILMYVSIRYGFALLLGILSVHRGMFHSLPAMLIAGELTFLAYKSDSLQVKTLMGAAVMLGFASHLILDEIYAVSWDGVQIKLNKFAGSAMKWVGNSWPANIFTYGLLFTLTFGILTENEWEQLVNPAPYAGKTRPGSTVEVIDVDEQPLSRISQSPGSSRVQPRRSSSNTTAPGNATRL